MIKNFQDHTNEEKESIMAHVIRVLADAEDKIANERPFRTRYKAGSDVPSLSAGPWVTDSYGNLPARLHDDVAASRYVVWSYDTPIAWVRQNGGTYVPNVGYSPTTGQHQAMARSVWGLPHMWNDPEPREVVKIPSTHILYGRERRLRSGGMDGSGSTLADHADNSPDAMHWRS